jgi:hypothetical protein
MWAWERPVLARLTLSQKLYILSFKVKSNGEINAIYITVLYIPSDRRAGADAQPVLTVALGTASVARGCRVVGR